MGHNISPVVAGAVLLGWVDIKGPPRIVGKLLGGTVGDLPHREAGVILNGAPQVGLSNLVWPSPGIG